MIRLNSTQMQGAAAHGAAAFELPLKAALQEVVPDAPCFASDGAWGRWWQDMLRSADGLGATDNQTVGLHALLLLVAGPSYLKDERLAWLSDILTDGSRHAPTYREIGEDFPAIASAVEETVEEAQQVSAQ